MGAAYKNSGPHVAHCSEGRKRRKKSAACPRRTGATVTRVRQDTAETCGGIRIPTTALGCKIITLVYIDWMPLQTSAEVREDAPTEASSHFACTAKGSIDYAREYHQLRDLATNHR